MKEQKGITLIALIITIIVMLILVAVSVTVLIQSDLIGAAKTAANEWEKADDHVDTLATDKLINNEESIQDLINALDTTDATDTNNVTE